MSSLSGTSGAGAQHAEDSMATATALSIVDMGSGLSLGSAAVSSSSIYSLRGLESVLTSHRDATNTNRGRGISLERTEKEKRTQDLPKGIYNTNPGDTGMTRAVASLTSTSSSTISNDHPTEGPRAQYRSWRDTNPDVPPGKTPGKTWSIGGQDDDDGHGGQVEKSIKDAMAGVEPNNRSRKASASLGFFKQGMPDDSSRSRDVKNRGRSKDSRTTMKISVTGDFAKAGSGHKASPLSSPGKFQLLERKSPLEMVPTKHSSTSHEQPMTDLIGELAPQAGYFDNSHHIETMSEDQVNTMPAQLLSDIRKHHNLTPGAGKGSSFSRSIPVTESEKLQERSSPDDNDATVDNESSRVKSSDEEEDSGEEQVASALFVPRPTPHESPERTREHSDASSTCSEKPKLDTPIPQQWLEEVPSQDVPEPYRSQESEPRPPMAIARSSSKKSNDFKPSTTTHQEATMKQLVDNTYQSKVEKAVQNDFESAQHGALKPDSTLEHAAMLSAEENEAKLGQPSDSVELIPYRHQVGGHTTMWRFSKKAVCKQLNNRENEFYEKVEHYHPKLLQFLPR